MALFWAGWGTRAAAPCAGAACCLPPPHRPLSGAPLGSLQGTHLFHVARRPLVNVHDKYQRTQNDLVSGDRVGGTQTEGISPPPARSGHSKAGLGQVAGGAPAWRQGANHAARIRRAETQALCSETWHPRAPAPQCQSLARDSILKRVGVAVDTPLTPPDDLGLASRVSLHATCQ